MMKKMMALLLVLVMLMAMGSVIAEDGMDDVAVMVNGEPITAGQVIQYAEYQLMNGYTDTLDYEQAISDLTINLIANQKIRELGLDQFTEEEKEAFRLDAQAIWDQYVQEYVAYYLTEDTDEARAQAAQDAEAYYAAYGYSVDVLYEDILVEASYNRLYDYVLAGQDTQVTDDEVQAVFMEYALADQEAFEGNVGMYETYVQYYGYESFYVPQGYRGVTHILLQVDEDLLYTYFDLSAKLEEEGSDVTEEDVANARQAVLASRKEDIDEIYARLANGESFETLIAEYGMDPGMTLPEYLQDGYLVHPESLVYDPVFTAAAFSDKMVKVGDVSDPVVGSYGIHIVYYLRDVPGGIVEMTDEMESTIREYLQSQKENEIISNTINTWVSESEIIRNEEVIASLGITDTPVTEEE